MKKHIIVVGCSILAAFLIVMCTGKKKDQDILVARIDYAPESCNVGAIASSSLHSKHLQFAKLLAIALGRSSSLRQAVKDASLVEGQEYFEEILVYDFLEVPVNGQSVRSLLANYFPDISSETAFTTFDEFAEDLLLSDPLLVIKIPDWYFNSEWDIATTRPDVVSNIRAPNQLLYGFRANGDCFSKISYFEFEHLEVVVKTSEDYLWIGGPDFLAPFPSFCLSHEAFFAQYARSFAGNYLLKKRDLHHLFLGCGSGPTDPDPDPPVSPCPRDTGFDHNYLIGFRLSHPNVLLTMNNQPCVGGEETFDFQIDFLYAARTGEQSAIDLKLPPLPLYGLRAKQLVNIITEETVLGIKKVVAVSPVYYPIRVNNNLFNYFEQISPSQKEWVVDRFGKEVYVTWNEVDFRECNASSGTTTTTSISATLPFNLFYSWFSKLENSNSTFNASYSKVSKHEVQVFGESHIPLGYCGLGYCDSLYSNFNDFPFRARRWYPTGPQALLVHFDYIVE